MILKKIAHKVAQAFRLAQAADKKLSTGIAAALDAKAEQLREYEKSFEPEPPKPDPLLEARTSLAQAGFSAAAATYALRRFAEALKPEPLSHLTNNWRKMHGLPMHRNLRHSEEGGKTVEQESRVNNPKPWIAQLFCRHHGEWFRRQEPFYNLSGETQYKVCTKCGKKLDERFIPNFDGS